MVRSVRMLFLVFAYGSIGVLAGYVWRSVDQQTEGQLRELSERAADMSPEQRAEQLEQLLREGSPFLETFGSMALDPVLPPLAMLVLQGSTWLLPLLILFVGYNRVADDLESRYTRYVLQRVHRESYLGGKILGHAAVCLAAVLLVQTVWIGLAFAFDMYGAARLPVALPRIWPAMGLIVVTYAAYTMLVSTLFARPVLALLLGTLLLYALWISAYVASVIWSPLSWAWLSSWYASLWRPDPLAYAVFAAYLVVFALLATITLRKVDV